MQARTLSGMLQGSALEQRADARMNIVEDFAAGLEIVGELAAQGYQPLREQWIDACRRDLNRAIERRLAELPEGWRLAVSEGELQRGEIPGQWELRHRFIAIDPHCPVPMPTPADGGRWTFYGPLKEARS